MTASKPHDDGVALVPLKRELLRIDWDSSEEAWLHHFGLVLSEVWGPVGHGMTLYGPPQVDALFREVILTGTQAPALRLYWTPEGIQPVIASSGPLNPEHLSKWILVLRETIQRLDQPLTTFAWAAYVAGGRLDIASSFSLSHLTIEPTGIPYVERQPAAVPQFGLWRSDWSYPVRVTGEADALNWDSALKRAGEDLYTACAVLSVAYDETWVVKHAPTVPTQVHAVPPWPVDELVGVMGNLDRRAIKPLAWLSDAFGRSSAREVAGPLSAYYRGLTLMDVDPPTALNLLAASIEGVGSGYVELTRCDSCGFMKGARQRYRFGVQLVSAGEEARSLNKLYDLRSGAAHGELIRGQELTVGGGFGRGAWFRTPHAAEELRGRLWDLQQASRRLMIRALTGDLPPP